MSSALKLKKDVDEIFNVDTQATGKRKSHKKKHTNPKITCSGEFKECDDECQREYRNDMNEEDRALCVQKTSDCKIVKGAKMGYDSSFGDVYYACCDKNGSTIQPPEKCNYIMKVVYIKDAPSKKYKTSKEAFMKEVNYQHIASTYKIAPTIVKAYLTQNRGIIIMERIRLSSWDYMRLAIQQISDEKGLKDAGWFLGIKLAEVIQSLILEARLFHGDLHLNNIMVEHDKGEFKQFKLIDFGHTHNVDPLDYLLTDHIDNEFKAIDNARKIISSVLFKNNDELERRKNIMLTAFIETLEEQKKIITQNIGKMFEEKTPAYKMRSKKMKSPKRSPKRSANKSPKRRTKRSPKRSANTRKKSIKKSKTKRKK